MLCYIFAYVVSVDQAQGNFHKCIIRTDKDWSLTFQKTKLAFTACFHEGHFTECFYKPELNGHP